MVPLGEDIAVLGRCISCFAGKRSANYCRIVKEHLDDRASVCVECKRKGATVTCCRQELRHKEENAAKLCPCIASNDTPPCCMELLSPKVEYYSLGESKGQPTNQSVIGYIIPYTEESWKSWMKQFTLQSGCEFTIRTGLQENQKSRESGVLRYQKSLHTYTSVWTRTYACLRGGKARFKPLKLSKKNRRSVGTRRVGCEAAIHLRLLRIARGMEILEVKVPMGTAHSHDLSSVADQICLKPLQQLEAKVSELVRDSLLNQRALRMALKTYVDNELIPMHVETGVIDKQPSLYNRAYYPNAEDIRVMVKKQSLQSEIHNSIKRLFCTYYVKKKINIS